MPVLLSKNKPAVERGGSPSGVATGPVRSVKQSGRCVIGNLPDRGGDSAPSRRAMVIVSRSELVGADGTFLERLLAVALHHEVGGMPDIDFRNHAGEMVCLRSSRFISQTCIGCKPTRYGSRK